VGGNFVAWWGVKVLGKCFKKFVILGLLYNKNNYKVF
jgi:hypothetical protein